MYGDKLIPAQPRDLNADGNVDFYDHMIAAATEMALSMGTDNDGTFRYAFMIGKRNYIEARVARQTDYAGQDKPNLPGQTLPTPNQTTSK